MTIFRIFLILAGLLEILSFSRGPRLGGKWTQSARSSALREVSQVTTSLRATIDPRQDIADRYSELSGSNITDIGLGLSQLEPFLKIAVPYFQNDATARSSLVAVSALTLLNSGISVAFSYISRDFYNALNARDESLFYEKIELFFGALVLGVPVSVLYRFVREKLALYWREALTAQALQQYYGNRTFYILETLREVDNPDQRISEDIRRFTSTSLDFFITIFTSIIDLLSFSAILFQIFPGLFLAIILYAGIGSVITTKIGRNLVALNYERLQREANFRFALFRTRENAEAIAFYDSEAKLEQENVWKLFQSALATQLSIVQTQRNLEVFTTAYRYIVQILPSLIVAPLYFQHKVELGAISQSYGAFNHILGDFSIIINSFESLSAFAAGLTRLGDFFDRIGGPSAAIGGGWGYLPSSSDETFANMFKTEMRTTRNSKPLISLHTVNFSQETLQLRPPQSESLRQSEFLKQRSQRPVLVQVQDLVVLTPDGTRCVLGSLRNDYHYRNNLSNSGRTIQGEQMALQARNTNDERAPKTTSSPSGTHDLHGPSSPSLLYRGIDLTFHAGDRVLIVGPSGAGKSSLVRVLAGLWSVGTGTIFWSDTLVTSSTLPSRPATTIGNLSADITHLSNNYTAQRSAPNGVFFLPQKPYNLLGDLREQIMYPATTSTSTTSATSSSFSSNQETRTDMLSPNRGDDKVSADSPLAPSIYQRMRLDQIAPSTSSAIVDPHLKLHADDDAMDSDAHFLHLLSLVKLDGLAERIGRLSNTESDSTGETSPQEQQRQHQRRGLRTPRDWSKTLSLGEQQRLAFARVLYNRPQLVFLDEATSALDLASEAALYQLLQEHDIAYVSVGHRPSLMRYHDCALVLRSQDDRVHSSKEHENSDGSDPQDEDHRHEDALQQMVEITRKQRETAEQNSLMELIDMSK